MAHKQKPLYHQVLVIVGATSEVGRLVLHSAVEQGSKIFMIDKDEDALQVIQDELRHKGYDSAYAVANLEEVDQIQFAADQCITTFGIIDSWINIPETKNITNKKIFEENFWGVVNSCNVAAPMLAGHGGTLINIGYAFKGPSLPRDVVDGASKEAIKGYTDAFRKDLKAKKSKVNVSFISTGTNKDIAKAILRCLEKPKKEIFPGLTLKEKIFRKKIDSTERSLIASGLGGMALVGGMTFFFMKKVRLL